MQAYLICTLSKPPALCNNLHLHQASSKPTAKPCAKRRLAILLPLEASSMLLLFYSAVAKERRGFEGVSGWTNQQ